MSHETPLPDRTPEDEDAFVSRWIDGQGTAEELEQAISTAIHARRPRLAARLVGLLDDEDSSSDDPALTRARHAARMLLIDTEAVDPPGWSALEDAWNDLRKTRIRRIKRAWRKRLDGRTDRTPRVGRESKRRR